MNVLSTFNAILLVSGSNSKYGGHIDCIFSENNIRHYGIHRTTGIMLAVGIVKMDEEWYIWRHATETEGTIYKRIPDSLRGIHKVDERGYIWIKFEFKEYEAEDWETFDELEHYYDEY